MTATPIVLERGNVNDESVTLVRWFAKNGERVEADALLAEIETSKANLEIYAQTTGFLQWAVCEGADVPVSSVIGHISETPVDGRIAAVPAESKNARAKPPMAAEVTAPMDAPRDQPLAFVARTPDRQRFSKLAERMMQAHGLTAADFAGKVLVRKQDVLDFLSPAGRTSTAAVPQSNITQPFVEVPLTKLKRSEGAALRVGMANAVASSVTVTCFTRGLRQNLKVHPIETGNLSAVIVYEVSRLLRKYPSLNATYRNGNMLRYEQVNVGFALDDGRGLKVAVFPKCDEMGLRQVADELFQLTLAYVKNRLTPAQISNATFTISDLSGLGVSGVYPLISEDQGAILGVSSEQFAPDSAYGFYTLTLTFDHQLSDGRTAANFLNDLKKRLQSYEDATVCASAMKAI
jgi:pyruvate dehydrogenase E2 component (dihydrolipoamide acetyltransferase)